MTKEEQARLHDRAKQFGLRTATYLRHVGLENKPKSKFDLQSIQGLAQVHGDLSRVGDLLKSWLSRTERQGFDRHLNIPQALGHLRNLQHELYRALEKL